MALSARGVVTITDITDGLPSISIIQSNENHTFPATSDGVVSDLANFLNDITVLVGADQAAYVTVTPTVNLTYTIGNPTITPVAGLTTTFSAFNTTKMNGVGTIDIVRMVIDTIDNTTTVQSVRVSVPITVRRLNQNVTVNVEVTISKAVGGSGSSLEIHGTRQTFMFSDYTATTPIADAVINADITLNALYDGTAAGNITWTQSVDGGVETALTPTTAGATTSSHVVTPASFANSSYITYKVTKGTVTDRMSIVRIDRGEASYIAVPRVTVGSLQLKNNTGSVTVTVDLFQGGTEITDYTGWTFQWFDGATLVADSATTATNIVRVDASCRTITVDASYVTDNGSVTLNILATK